MGLPARNAGAAAVLQPRGRMLRDGAAIRSAAQVSLRLDHPLARGRVLERAVAADRGFGCEVLLCRGRERLHRVERQVRDGQPAHKPRGERAAEHVAGDTQARMALAELGVRLQGAVRAPECRLPPHPDPVLRDDAAAGGVPARAVWATRAVHGGRGARERVLLQAV